jgi:predicted nucleic acid-binding protein
MLLIECASSIRSAELGNILTPERASRAFEDLLDVRAALLPFHRFAQRIWQLRQTVTPYDAWYVSIAEAYGVTLATLDRRLTRAPGPRCDFLIP